MIGRYFHELWAVLTELSLPFLFGLLIAGVLHVFVPRSFIKKRLSKPGIRSVFEAALVGVPIPLCSCGVLPTGVSLLRSGASKGAVTSFLISTPQTGVDSILVSASFLGWPFALFKLFSAFVTGLLGGFLVDRFDQTNKTHLQKEDPPETDNTTRPKLREIFTYPVFELLSFIDIYLVIGIALAALLNVFLPAGSLSQISWTQGFYGMFFALVVGLPLYICATSSVPVAAALVSAGMPTGAALVFLMAGPATNLAAMSVIKRALGMRVLVIYLGSLAAGSMSLGYLFDWVVQTQSSALKHSHVHGPGVFEIAASILFIALLAFLIGLRVYKLFAAKTTPLPMAPSELVFSVQGMSCDHCAANVKNSLCELSGVQSIEVDLKQGKVAVSGDNVDPEAVQSSIEALGYRASPL